MKNRWGWSYQLKVSSCITTVRSDNTTWFDFPHFLCQFYNTAWKLPLYNPSPPRPAYQTFHFCSHKNYRSHRASQSSDEKLPLTWCIQEVWVVRFLYFLFSLSFCRNIWSSLQTCFWRGKRNVHFVTKWTMVEENKTNYLVPRFDWTNATCLNLFWDVVHL